MALTEASQATTAKLYIDSDKPRVSANTLVDCTHNDILHIALSVTTQLNTNTEQRIDIENVKQLFTEQQFDGKSICNMPLHEFNDIAMKYSIFPEKSSEMFHRIIHYFESDNKDEVKDTFTEFDLDEIKDTMERFRMSWMQITNCVEHEMYPKIANIMRTIIDNKADHVVNIGLYDIDTKHIENMIDILKTERNLAMEEREYLRKLCQRAVMFVPITTDVRKRQNTKYDDDFDQENDGLNSKLLQDIFDIHRHFMFSAYHFNEYTVQQYRNDIINVCDEYSESKRNEATELNKLKNSAVYVQQRFNFYPSYIIHDDLFEISDYVFEISRYVHYIRNNMKHRINKIFRLKLVIIPKSVRSVYHEDIVFPYNIQYIDDYLRDKGILDYLRSFEFNLQNQCSIDIIERNGISKLLIIIDRRFSVDIVYMLSCSTSQQFRELNENYFLGFDFNVIPTGNHHNKVTAYVRYGIHEKSRFYPEMMLSLIARLFKKPSDIPPSDLLHTMYSHKYKHAFSLELEDELLNVYYKMITGYTHISVNINRAFLITEYSAAKEILFFRDLLQYEMNINHLESVTIKETTEFIMDEEYDSEAIIDDIREDKCSNIENCFISNDKQSQFGIIRMIVSKYSNTTQNNKQKSCSIDHILDLKRCKHVCYSLEALTTFNKANFSVNTNAYSVCMLLEAYDHIIDVHQFNRTQSNERIKEHFAQSIGYCLVEDCSLLDKHRMRRRERGRRICDVDSALHESGDSLKEIISATLIAMHCYILHKEKRLFRLERSEDNLHFITPKDQNDNKLEEETNTAMGIQFGVSVLQWLKYDEKPTFSSFKEEIIKNKESTISHSLYLSFAQECFIKMIGRKSEQYTLDEMMSLKIYTDTDSYQSAFRKSFWKTSLKDAKRSFYHWAMQLHKTTLFHSKPTHIWKITDLKPLRLSHGLNMVFTLDNALPMYNGPISISWDGNVAHIFSKGRELIWTMQPSYTNRFTFATGIDTIWISHHKNEAAFLLVNQYLPIVRTQNFENDIHNNVDHLLYSLKTFRKAITSSEQFYRVIGLIYNDKKGNHCNPEWISIIKEKKQSFLYQPTVLNSKCILERLVEELNIELFMDQYKVLSSKFEIIPHFAFNYYSIIGKVNDMINMSCTIINNDDNITMEFEYDGISLHKIQDMSREVMPIQIKNSKLFGCDEYIKIQDVHTKIFEQCTNAFYDSLTIKDDKLILLQDTIRREYHKEILDCKYALISNDDGNEQHSLESDTIYNNDHYIYQFDDMDALHFIVPYAINMHRLSLYVQLKHNYHFILFKSFEIDHEERMTKDNVSIQVDYLLNVLRIYQYPVSSSNAFFKAIKIAITTDHIEILENHHFLKENHDSDADNHVLDILIEDLNISKLLSLRKPQTKQYQNINIEEILEAKENLDRIEIVDTNNVNYDLLEIVQQSVNGIFGDDTIGNCVVQVLYEQFRTEQDILADLRQYNNCKIINIVSTELTQNKQIKHQWNQTYDEQILYQLLQNIFREKVRDIPALIKLFSTFPSSLKECTNDHILIISLIVAEKLNSIRNNKETINIDTVKQFIIEQRFDGKALSTMTAGHFTNKMTKHSMTPDLGRQLFTDITHYWDDNNALQTIEPSSLNRWSEAGGDELKLYINSDEPRLYANTLLDCSHDVILTI